MKELLVVAILSKSKARVMMLGYCSSSIALYKVNYIGLKHASPPRYQYTGVKLLCTR